MEYYLAQVNIAKALAPLNNPIMEGFVSGIEKINQLADRSKGFIWRLQSDEGDATYIRPYEDELILFNMSVWDSVEALKNFVYQSEHVEFMRKRKQWFQHLEGAYLALWWIEKGHIPTIDEAKSKLEYLNQYGPTLQAFSFNQIFLV